MYLTDPVNPETVARAHEHAPPSSRPSPNVDYENKDEACDRFKTLFANQKALVENVDCDALPGVAAGQAGRPRAVRAGRRGRSRGQPGIDRDRRPERRSWSTTALFAGRLRVFRVGVLLVAIVMLVVGGRSSIANTVRMGLFARRKEIGIMKLVGATNWRIRVPFLIEGLFESLIGARRRDPRSCSAIKVAFIDPLHGTIQFVPLDHATAT